MADFNDLRRRVVAAMDEALTAGREERVGKALALRSRPWHGSEMPVCWEVAVDRPEYLQAIAEADLGDTTEVVLFIHRLEDAGVDEAIATVLERTGPQRLRLALPAVIRPGLAETLQPRIERLLARGLRRWEVANLAGLSYLAGGTDLDLAAGWPLHVLNRVSLAALADLGFSSAAASPEDGRDNLARLLASAGDRLRVTVYQDTPLAISAVCAFASARQGCTGGSGSCGAETMVLESRRGDRLLALNDHCQTVILNAEPLCWSQRVPELVAMGARRLRAEFVWRRYEPTEIAGIWSRVRRGEPIEATHEANWERGLDQDATAPAASMPPE
jgi:hypothetical protein